MNLKHFEIEEFNCKETGSNNMSPNFLVMLDRLRELCDFPFVITSGYRSPEHSAERNKPNGGGTHTKGIAADIAVKDGYQRYLLVEKAIELGFKGVGVAKGFVHVDLRNSNYPVMWSY
jgi:zinc D-Ala-D-Ala carboxypeptidase